MAGLDKPFSLYLGRVRILAACAVVMAQFGYFHIFDDSQIAYSAEQRNPTLGDYVRARCARLYSVVLPILALANFACARHAGFTRLPGAARTIRFVSAHTFTLYLSHSLVICTWQALLTFRRGDPAVPQPSTDALRRRLRR